MNSICNGATNPPEDEIQTLTDIVVVVVDVSLQVSVGADQSARFINGNWFGIVIVCSAVSVLKLLSVSLSDLIFVLNVTYGFSK